MAISVHSWKSLPLYPLATLESGGGIIRDQDNRPHLLVFGGYISGTDLTTTHRVYSLAVNQNNATWVRRRNMPKDATHVAQAFNGNLMYTCGGYVGTAPGKTIVNCYVYDMIKDTWTTMPDLPGPRGGGGMAYVPGKKGGLVFTSGNHRKHQADWNGEDMSDTWMLRNGEKKWRKRAMFPNPRNHMAGIVGGKGKVWFLGGQKKNSECCTNQKDVWRYKVWTDKWVKGPQLSFELGHIAPSVFGGWGGVWVMGGVSDHEKRRNQVLYMNGSKWKVVGKMPVKVQGAVCGRWARWVACATGAGMEEKGRGGFKGKVKI